MRYKRILSLKVRIDEDVETRDGNYGNRSLSFLPRLLISVRRSSNFCLAFEGLSNNLSILPGTAHVLLVMFYHVLFGMNGIANLFSF